MCLYTTGGVPIFVLSSAGLFKEVIFIDSSMVVRLVHIVEQDDRRRVLLVRHLQHCPPARIVVSQPLFNGWLKAWILRAKNWRGLGMLFIGDKGAVISNYSKHVLLPDENTLDLLPRIKQRRPELPIIMMSAQNTLLTAVRATERGAFDYLPKPFDLSQLLTVVKRALDLPRRARSTGRNRGRSRSSCRSSAARRRCRRSTGSSLGVR